MDGLDCLRKMRQTKPDVLVLDQEMHWGGGDGVLAWLREQSARFTTSVVMTATAGSATPVAAPPVVEFLPKPFTLAILLESVRAAVGRNGEEKPLSLHSAAECSELFIG